MMTSVQQITEVVVKMPRAITLPVASNVPVNMDSPEMDSRAAVSDVILTYHSPNKNLLAVPSSRTILAIGPSVTLHPLSGMLSPHLLSL